MGKLQINVVLLTLTLIGYSVMALVKTINVSKELQDKSYKEILEFYGDNGNNKFIDLLLTLIRPPGGIMGTWNLTNEAIVKNAEYPLTRFKRSGGSNRYLNTAQMSQMKLLRLQLQMIKNIFAKNDIGGKLPISAVVPKTFMTVFKDKIYNVLIPDVGFSNQESSK